MVKGWGYCWVLVASQDWLKPIVDLMHKKLLKEEHMHVDETTVQVMNEDGRKNWLFSGSPKGAAASATVYSIIESAKANGLNPYKYLY